MLQNLVAGLTSILFMLQQFLTINNTGIKFKISFLLIKTNAVLTSLKIKINIITCGKQLKVLPIKNKYIN